MYDVCMYMGIPMPQHTVALRGLLWIKLKLSGFVESGFTH